MNKPIQRIQITVRVYREQYAFIKRYAKRHLMGIATAVRQLLEVGINHVEKREKSKRRS